MVDTVSTDPFTNLYLDHADIRREVAKEASDLRFEGSQNTGDLRREVAKESNDIIKEGLKESFNIRGDVQDSRFETAKATNEIVKEGLKESFNTRGDVKDARYDLSSRITDGINHVTDSTGANFDRLDKQASDFFIAGQQYAFNAARDVAALKSSTDAGFQKVASDIFTQGALTASAANLEAAKNAAAAQLEAAKNTAAIQLELAKNATAAALGQAAISRDIVADGEKTRALLNDHKYHDLNRHLIERESALVEMASENRHWHHRYDDARWAGNRDQFAAQFAALQSTMQNFNSQLSETRQGMTNFGSMVGVGQSSTANSVR